MKTLKYMLRVNLLWHFLYRVQLTGISQKTTFNFWLWVTEVAKYSM